MLLIPEWFTQPSWVLNFDDLREAVGKAVRRRDARLKYRKTLRAKWRLARARHG